MSYNKDIDYQEKINEAVKNGDYEGAALYEKSRNEKIDAENLDYEKTNRYSGWLDKTDYSAVLREQMDSGASRKTVAETLGKRVNKAAGTDGLSQYAKDSVYDEAVRYIMGEGSFNYQGKEPQYEGKYDKKIDQLLGELSNIKKFSYNPLNDELYKYYKEEYQREGERAMEDVLGELSTNTGGIASSYAAAVAAQSRNYYNEKLTDKIPELYQAAYERYLDELGLKEENLKTLLDIREDDYNIYKDSVSQYNKNREFEYNKFLDEKDYEKYLRDEERKDEEFEYEKFIDNRDYEYQKFIDNRDYEYQKSIDDSEHEDYIAEQKKEEAERENENYWNRIKWAIEKWQTLGYLDEESAEILGLPAGLHTSDFDYKKAQAYKLYNK